jgi:hypothetical protein
MSVTEILLTGLTGVVFALWTYLMFRTLMDQRRRATRRTGAVFPGLRDALIEWGHWLRSPDHARDRGQLAAATLTLILLIALNALIVPGGP